MSIANATHCSMMGGGSKYQILGSMKHYNNSTYDVGVGFYADSLGALPTGITISAWYKITDYNYSWGLSKSIFKYGNRNDGAAFGTFRPARSQLFARAGLIEAKYWACLGTPSSTIPADVSWHHVAMIIKSGSSPLFNSIYIDGVLQIPQSGSGTTAMNAPTSMFTLLGRDNGSAWESGLATAFATRVCIFGSQMSASDIMADYLAGMSMPKNTSLTHYWDATVENNKVIDKVGNWNLTFSTGCSISDDTPWGAVGA